ncbi:MAG TPA: hypothetical protein VN837_20140 [Chloroflexota bacterium]|nr:hypothetical protein [Chloroflexota bacterium]
MPRRNYYAGVLSCTTSKIAGARARSREHAEEEVVRLKRLLAEPNG